MSISSSICADYANKRKEMWTEKFRKIYKKSSSSDEAIHQIIKLIKEIEDFEFIE